MKNSLRNHKMVLGVHSHMEHLLEIEKELMGAHPTILFYKATTYEEGLQLMLSYTFDLVISETSVEQGTELIALALRRNFPVLIISENGQSPDELNQLYGLKIQAVSSKEDTTKIVQDIGKTLRAQNKLSLRLVIGKILTACTSIMHTLTPQTIDRKYYALPSNCIYY
jgi:hypothetical protein